jgi:segregation and condensation protein A
MSINIALPLFEGPLDLLLHLIRENKIDIYDIPISLITKQYLEYLDLMKELDIEIASEFLIMAANLIYIKSRMLLPKPEKIDEEDPRQELVTQLVEHIKFKEISKTLNERYKIWSKAFPRKTFKEDEVFLQEINIFDLLTALKRIIHKNEAKISIPKDPIRVEDKIDEILKVLTEKKNMLFEDFFEKESKKRHITKLEIIVTFLAILELIRLKVIKAYQKNHFGKIFITKLEENNDNRNNF